MARKKPRRQSKKSAHSRGTKRRRKQKIISGLKRDLERKSSLRFRRTAKELSGFVPSLKPLTKKSRLTQAEKSRITRYSKALSGVENLHPVNAAYAKKYQNELFHGKNHKTKGIRAIQLNNASPHAKIVFKTSGDLNVESNGQTWIYWRLDKATVRNKKGQLGKKAGDAFAGKFPIEVVSELAEKAFRTLDVQQVHLWTNSGRVPQGFQSLRQFVLWMNDKWQAGRYVAIRETSENSGNFYEMDSDPAAWISGLAILVREPKKPAKKTQKRKKK